MQDKEANAQIIIDKWLRMLHRGGVVVYIYCLLNLSKYRCKLD